MQTPGKKIEPQTPMIVINRRVDMTLERLTRVEEDLENIERPQRRIFGSIISQFQTINNSMKNMQELVRDDIRAKKKYYAEETKILKKDSRNLTSLNMSFGRQLAASALGLYGLSQLSKGNLGEGAAGIGGAAALLTPEILGVITTVVTTKLASSGLLGRGGVGTMGSRVAGASKLKNPLLITAALAASLILPGLISSNQNADRRRQISASKTIRGQETINKPDVIRFRGILSRFDSILSNISLERKKSGAGGVGDDIVDEALKEDDKGFFEGLKDLFGLGDDKEKKDDKKNSVEGGKNSNDTSPPSDTEDEKGGFFEGFKKLFGLGKNQEEDEKNISVEGNTDISNVNNTNISNTDNTTISNVDNTTISNVAGDTTNLSRIDNSLIEGDVNIDERKNEIKLGSNNFSTLNKNEINNEVNLSSNIPSIIIEPDKSNNVNMLPNMSIQEIYKNEIVNMNIASGGGGGGEPQVIDISQDSKSVPNGFTQETATPVFVSVGTKFNKSIDKFESAASLRTWGAFT